MRKIEILGNGVLIGAVPIIICFLAGWWISIPFVPEQWIVLFALAGLFLGVIIDILFLRKWIQNVYSMRPIVGMMIYILYSFGMFGFFMGVPVFNVALALPAGFFISGWLVNKGADSIQMEKSARHLALFTTSVLAFICVSSAAIALNNSSTASDLQGMLGFQFTTISIVSIIIIGGVFILILQWWLTSWSVKIAYQYFISHDSPS
jgi:hypothetical protein